MRPMRIKRDARGIVERAHELIEQLEEKFLLAWRESRQHTCLCFPCRFSELRKQFFARFGELETMPSAVVGIYGAHDQPILFQLLEHHSGGGAIETQEIGNRNLVDTRLVLEHEQDAVLGIGHSKVAGFLNEQRDRNLVHAPDHETRTSI